MNDKQDKNHQDHIDDLIEKMRPMIEGLHALQEQATAIGLFANHRDLAACINCNLFENVTAHGVLFVYRGKNYDEDTALKFEELDDNAVKCPECGKIFCPYDADLHNWPMDE